MNKILVNDGWDAFDSSRYIASRMACIRKDLKNWKLDVLLDGKDFPLEVHFKADSVENAVEWHKDFLKKL
ncbi:MAG: hypothetical protein DWQ49_08975 [Bacteroidetes bacterium]|nr:MAG: hypothetical protein DWQ49_08975 [Bacteroidota bacterium]